MRSNASHQLWKYFIKANTNQTYNWPPSKGASKFGSGESWGSATMTSENKYYIRALYYVTLNHTLPVVSRKKSKTNERILGFKRPSGQKNRRRLGSFRLPNDAHFLLFDYFFPGNITSRIPERNSIEYQTSVSIARW